MKIKTLILTFSPGHRIVEDASKLRGFFATKFNEYVLLHQHIADKFVYKYPLIQYKMIDGVPLIFGINEGVEVLKEIYDKYDEIRLGDSRYIINERGMIIKDQDFGLSKKFWKYQFVTPWFALNQDNYKKYYSSDRDEQYAMLRKILVGNLLSVSKGIGYEVVGEIKADVKVKPQKRNLKNTVIMEFTGTFIVNFDIPSYMGIGKSVSRGFGAVQKE